MSRVSVCILAQAQNAEASTALVVNRAARLRALSQRFVKFRAQQLLQISPEATLDGLTATEKIIKSHMAFLNSMVPTQSRGQLDKLAKNITVLMSTSGNATGKEGLVQTNTAAADVLTNADVLTAEVVASARFSAFQAFRSHGH